MKKIFKIFALILIFNSFFIDTVFANNQTGWNYSGNNKNSILLEKGISSSSDKLNRYGKGEIFAEGSVEITNLHNGDIYIYAYTLAHRNVDSIYCVVFLDQWDDKRNDWVGVDFWEVDRFKEDEANGELSYLMFNITVSGYPVNKYYRVRGLHQVEFADKTEGGSTATHGVFITKD